MLLPVSTYTGVASVQIDLFHRHRTNSGTQFNFSPQRGDQRHRMSGFFEKLQVGCEEACEIIDNFDRPLETSLETGVYHDADAYATWGFENKPGKRVPKIGAKMEAGYGAARGAVSVLEGEVRGPNALGAIGASPVAATAIVRAELASAKLSLGPLHVKAGAGFDSGGSLGLHGVEAKFLGCGFTLGRKNSLSIFGSEIGFTLFTGKVCDVEYKGKSLINN